MLNDKKIKFNPFYISFAHIKFRSIRKFGNAKKLNQTNKFSAIQNLQL